MRKRATSKIAKIAPERPGYELVRQPLGHRWYVKRDAKLKQYPSEDTSFEGILKTAQDVHGIDEFVVGFSGGKDSGVVLDRMVKGGFSRKVLHLITRTGIKPTEDFVDQKCKDYDIKFNPRYPPPFEFIYVAMCLQYGFGGPHMHPMYLKYLKYKTIQKFLAEKQFKGKKVAIVTGVQKFESIQRMGRYNNPITQDGQMWQVMPIFWESQASVYSYYLQHKIKRSPAYDYTKASLECNCSSYASREDMEAIKALDPQLAKYFKWIEYGIQHFGTTLAKKYKKWGEIGMQYDEAQTHLFEAIEDMSPDEWKTIEAFVCGEECGPGTLKEQDY